MSLKRGIVRLEEYNPNWELEYAKEAELLKKVLGKNIIEIEHIGSTSIKGLMAKPIIDIIIVLKDFNNIEEIERLLKDYGYQNHGQHGVEDRYFFTKGSEEARTHYLHFTTPNSNTYYDQVYFKRFLLEHDDYLKEYCALKQKLASIYPEERSKYTEGKKELISKIIKLAKKEYDK